ncbi:MAG: hypothetical protein V1692_02720, partial [bacterium]
GAEWYPYPPLGLIDLLILVFILLMFALVVFALKARKRSAEEWSSLLLALAFLILTIKSRRNVEYFVPWAVLFSALALNGILKEWSFQRMWHWGRRFLQRRKLAIVLTAYALITFVFLYAKGINQTKDDYRQGAPFTRLAEASQWLKENVPAKEVIFHSDWDDFPMLFYYNDQGYYISGLDSTFMYKYSPVMYNQWVAITKGEQKDDLYNLIQKGFHASYVVVGKDHPDLKNNLNATMGATRVFESPDAWVYKLW